MSLEDPLSNFDGTSRLFPLPNFVMFPHAILPLHIFEPRYRQMTEDALASDRFVTMCKIAPTADWKKMADPPIEPVACLGRILEYERLPDGRFNFLLVGKSRVRIVNELPKTKLYRRATVELLEDVYQPDPDPASRSQLIELYRSIALNAKSTDPDLLRLLDSDVAMGPLTDIISHSLGLPIAIKQSLLCEVNVEDRARELITMLRQVVGGQPHVNPSRHFPPRFSDN